ncbi:unnamed protein product [Lampetra planeri]
METPSKPCAEAECVEGRGGDQGKCDERETTSGDLHPESAPPPRPSEESATSRDARTRHPRLRYSPSGPAYAARFNANQSRLCSLGVSRSGPGYAERQRRSYRRPLAPPAAWQWRGTVE